MPWNLAKPRAHRIEAFRGYLQLGVRVLPWFALLITKALLPATGG